MTGQGEHRPDGGRLVDQLAAWREPVREENAPLVDDAPLLDDAVLVDGAERSSDDASIDWPEDGAGEQVSSPEPEPGPDIHDLPERIIVVTEAAPAPVAPPPLRMPGIRSDLDALRDGEPSVSRVDPRPEPSVTPRVEPRVDPPDEATGPGTLRPMAPRPVKRGSRSARPSETSHALNRLRAALGLLVVVVFAGVALASAIGLAVGALTLLLRQAVSG